MAAIRFEWDERKSAANVRKRGISFDEAASVFADENALLLADPDHSDEEDRFIAIGPTRRGLVLVVYTERDEDTVRIITARWATKRESAMYRSHIGGGES